MNKTYLKEQDNKVHKKVRRKLEKKRRIEKETVDIKKDKRRRKDIYLKVNEIQKEYQDLNILKIKNLVFDFCDNFPKEIEDFKNIFKFLDEGSKINTQEIEHHNTKIILQKIFILFNLTDKNGEFSKPLHLHNLFNIIDSLIPVEEIKKVKEKKKHQIVEIRRKQMFRETLDKNILEMFGNRKKKIGKNKNIERKNKFSLQNKRDSKNKLCFGINQIENQKNEENEENIQLNPDSKEIDYIFSKIETKTEENKPKKRFRIIKKY